MLEGNMKRKKNQTKVKTIKYTNINKIIKQERQKEIINPT